jgi:hypothetical protein
MTGGRFHRIKSAAAAKCPERLKLPDFHTAWAQSGGPGMSALAPLLGVKRT